MTPSVGKQIDFINIFNWQVIDSQLHLEFFIFDVSYQLLGLEGRRHSVQEEAVWAFRKVEVRALRVCWAEEFTDLPLVNPCDSAGSW